jgi:unsaturated rhamnogalacturonyl hydrolase
MMRLPKTPIYFLLLITLVQMGCKPKQNTTIASTENTKIVSEQLKWSERMALSEIHRFPDPTLLDFQEKPRWSYTNGLVLQAMSKVYEQNGNQKIMDYIESYAEKMINEDGSINTYKMSNFNLDMIKSGDAIFFLYQKNRENRYRIAMDSLHKQMELQPTTSEGGYWHKKIYPYQMWLDGVFMAEPFHAQYALTFMDETERQKVFDKIVLQFDLIEKHNRDSVSGLYFHGWDESKQQQWADSKTGLSKNFWSRGMGWYGMALVDVLDYLPNNHPGRLRIIQYLNQYAEAIVAFQDHSGTWYQVLDQPTRVGNYLEATGSCMFTYTLAKGVRMGYLPKEYFDYAQKGFNGILKTFITVDNDGIVNLNQCCAVAGLGGNPYRDGSYEYYIGEKIRSNDPKGTGPFIMMALEFNQ